jgi:uncharacterized protein (TIGR03067 family)
MRLLPIGTTFILSACLVAADAPTELAKSIEGKWVLKEDGMTESTNVTISDGTMKFGDRKDGAPYTIDESKTPARITLQKSEDSKVTGIIKVKGDTILVALNKQEAGPVPTDFEKGDGKVILTFTRVPATTRPAAAR